jgi:hypothetical protein
MTADTTDDLILRAKYEATYTRASLAMARFLHSALEVRRMVEYTWVNSPPDVRAVMQPVFEDYQTTIQDFGESMAAVSACVREQLQAGVQKIEAHMKELDELRDTLADAKNDRS